MGFKILGSALFLIGLSTLSACGVKSGAHDTPSISNISAKNLNEIITGIWKLEHISCTGEESTVVTSAALTQNLVTNTTQLAINSESYRLWTIGSCEIKTPLTVKSITADEMVLDEGIATCNTGCEIYCSGVASGVVSYPYSLVEDVLVVKLPQAQANVVCGSTQSTSDTQLTYQRN